MSGALVERLGDMARYIRPHERTLATQALVKVTPEQLDDIAALLTEAAQALTAPPYFHGYKIVVDPSMPEKEIRFVAPDGKVVGKIIDFSFD